MFNKNTPPFTTKKSISITWKLIYFDLNQLRLNILFSFRDKSNLINQPLSLQKRVKIVNNTLKCIIRRLSL
ncbi:hypothetical protein F9876_11525 [Morganella morganii]|nr:hypothetical protein [Morganella morganii]